jgi:hypothetical protein
MFVQRENRIKQSAVKFTRMNTSGYPCLVLIVMPDYIETFCGWQHRFCTMMSKGTLSRSPTEATRLRFDQEEKLLYSRLLVEPSIRNGASPTSAITIQ